MDILTADVKAVVIVRRDRQRHGPDKTVLQLSRCRSVALVRPDFNVTSLAGRQVETFDDAADASRSRSAGPDDVVINRIRRGPTALATADRLPGAARNLPGPPAKPATARIARSAIRRIVLFVAVDVIGNAVVDGHVIYLRNGELDAVPRLAARY